MPSSPSLPSEKKHWWLSNKKVVEKYLRDARVLIASQQTADVTAALGLIEAALVLAPRLETTLELKARSLLFLRRFRDVADMLQDYIPSFRAAGDDDSGTSLSGAGSAEQLLPRERAKLLSSGEERSDGERSFRCFSVADLKKKVMAGLCKNSEKEGQWRYLVLGQACSHLGLMEDAIALLQTGRRLATAAFRRESVCWSEDSFSFTDNPSIPPPPSLPSSESEAASHLVSHIKFLLRRRAAAIAALDANLPNESVRHFSKILDGRRSVPQAFAAYCFVGRASAYRAAGRLAEAIADCNRALALDPASIPALRERADLLEAVRSHADCLHDLDHLKLLYDSILRDQKLPGPAWKPHYDVRYRDIPSNLRTLTARIQLLRLRVAAGEGSNVDYYALIGVRRGCSRSELERAHRLLSLKHRPDKAGGFVDRLEFVEEHRELDEIRDQARMSALLLYRLLQKGYSSIMATVMEEEMAEKMRVREAAAVVAAMKVSVAAEKVVQEEKAKTTTMTPASAPVYQGVFCRDMAAVGSLLAQVGFNRAIPVKYEALSC
ncbi:uncharacterized protein LOC120265915 [Dioscorea cayenensis subsp. rotundata]|uniref:Uncharacterized protein LOC120265915 n=1 Tax=Dioscorea cayennensis subsp. rotundata TaxID=55577 RepID=A0AB40BRN2_DIOCR|nr:uncharacterized protein LOC120265915 [Dioscorea cayenensis subsp. rotundata]